MNKTPEFFFAAARQVGLSPEERASVRENLVRVGGFDRLHQRMPAHESPFLQAAQDASLNEKEKDAVRKRLQSFIALRPKRASVRNPFVVGIEDMVHTIFRSAHSHAVLAMLLILATIFSTGGGLAYAAESALPGETLYNVKVNVVEPLRGQLLFDDESRARWETRRLERRLEEAEKLARRQEITPEHRQLIEARIERHADRIEERFTVMEEHDPSLAAAMRERHAAALQRHESLLEELSTGQPNPAALHEIMEHVKRVRGKMHRFRQALPPFDGMPPLGSGSVQENSVRIHQEGAGSTQLRVQSHMTNGTGSVRIESSTNRNSEDQYSHVEVAINGEKVEFPPPSPGAPVVKEIPLPPFPMPKHRELPPTNEMMQQFFEQHQEFREKLLDDLLP